MLNNACKLNCIFVQFDDQKDQAAVEQILRVIFLDPECPSPVSRSKIYTSSWCFVSRAAASTTLLCACHNDTTYGFVLVSYIKALEKLKRQLAEAEAELESRKKPPEETGPRVVGEGLVIDEWVREP